MHPVDLKPVDHKYLGVASLYGRWKSADGEELVMMSFLMRPASKYVMEHGHHRQLFFIEEAGFDSWMEPQEWDAEKSLAILRQFAYEEPLEYTIARQMAQSWKSRQKERLADRDEQLAGIDEGGPLGI